MGSPLLSKRFYQQLFASLSRGCSLRRLLLILLTTIVLIGVAVYAYGKAFVATYYWQVTDFANFIRPIRRTSCLHVKIDESLRTNYKIGLLSVYADSDSTWNEELMRRVTANREAYCVRHGYVCVNGNEYIDHTRPVAWSKLVAMEKVLSRFDYVMYVDMDVVIMEPSLPIQTFINQAPQGTDFIMTNDWSGPNTGIWITRNSSFSAWFLNEAFAQKQLQQPYASNGYKHPFEYEQRAFHYLMNTPLWTSRHLPRYSGHYADEINKHFYSFPQCAFNSYIVHPFEFRADRQVSQYIPGDFLVHFAGKKGQIKTDLMKKYLDIAAAR